MASMTARSLSGEFWSGIRERRSGKTVSTADTEIASMSCEEGDELCCDEMSELEECYVEPGPIGPIQGGTTLPSTFTWDYCTGISNPLPYGSDADSDGLRDDCEYQFAYAFRPHLAMNSDDQHRANEPYYSVRRQLTGNDGTVAIFYALSYYRDPGDPYLVWAAHDGDSEFIIVKIRPADGSRYALTSVTLSAHWNTGSSDNTGVYNYSDVEYPTEYRGRPRVWVAWNKHANYRTKHICDTSWNDTCDTGFSWTVYSDAVIIPAANLGNSWHQGAEQVSTRLIDCTQSRVLGYTGRSECFWSDSTKFLGWHINTQQAAASPYRTSLSFFGF